MNQEKLDIQRILAMKGRRKITMLTAYDYPTASLIDRVGIDIILVGDSLANVVLGLDSTTKVGMPEMLHHTKAVTRAVHHALIVGDMPYGSYQFSENDAIKNARLFIEEGKADVVKIEWFEACVETSKAIIKAGIPVMGHIGLTPQSADKLGGFKVQGKDAASAGQLISQALALEGAGIFALVLECVPDRIAELITRKLKIPTIGIGAGVHCDGQVLVLHDMLGLFERYTPKFIKKYCDLTSLITQALAQYKEEVLRGDFPAAEHSFTIKEEEFKKLLEENEKIT